MPAVFNTILVGLLLWATLLQSQAQQTTPTPQASPPAIFFPPAGQALQGSVPISGHTAVEGFQSAELNFSYYQDPRETWFIIQEMDRPISNGELADWDTTTLTDGQYTLRLVIFLDRGEPLVLTIAGLRVRNYTPVETDTPPPPPTPAPGFTPAPTSSPTPTLTPLPPARASLPPNPAEISPVQITGSLAKGALAVLGMFTLLAFYSGLRWAVQWRRDRS